MPEAYDVVVVGAGNAAFSAALSAREQGARVVVIEKAPEPEMGGNTRFTAGAIRCVYDDVSDLKRYMPDLTDNEIAISDFGTYTEEQYFDDMFRVTQFRTDPDMCEILVKNSRSTMLWMQEKGVRFVPIWGRQAYKVDGRFTFFGGLTVESSGGGPGLIQYLTAAAKKAGIPVLYDTGAMELLYDDYKVYGLKIRRQGKVELLKAKSVVLACGGFEANHEWRTRYLGPGWELAKVRGTRFNQGDGIRMAIDIGAAPYGNWSGCHAVGWDRNAPEFGDLAVGDGFQKHSYPIGVLINAEGKRFVDEGADFRNYTYAKYGRVILAQPGQFAWQIFDKKVVPMLRDEYRIRQVTKVTANTLEELATKLEGVNPQAFLKTIHEYNASVQVDKPFNPNIKDGRGTPGIPFPKTNWANRIDEPSFEAFGVGCGITFTFGGLRVNGDAQVLASDLSPIPGLYAAGEVVGGLFYFNYPGGTGLMSGSVYGRIAGRSAGEAATAGSKGPRAPKKPKALPRSSRRPRKASRR